MGNNSGYQYSWDLNSNKKSRIELSGIDKHSIRPSTCYRIGNLRVTDAFYSAFVYEQMVILQNSFIKNRKNFSTLDGPIGNVFGYAWNKVFSDTAEEFFFEYNSVPSGLFDRILPVITILPEIDYMPIRNNAFLKPFSYNEEFYISLLDDIFKSFGDEEIYEKFKGFVDPKNKRIFITPHWEHSELDNMTLVDTFNHKAFTYLNVNDNIIDFFALGGSLLHMCIRENVARSGYEEREEKYLYDLENHFFSFVASEYIRGMNISGNSDVFLNIINQFESFAYYDMIHWAFSLMFIKALVETEDPEYVKNGYSTRLRKDIGWRFIPKIDDINGLLNSVEFSFFTNNLTSYMAAKDIHKIYSVDKNEGISLLRLNASLTTSPIDSLELIGTTFAHDGYDGIIEYGKYLKQKTKV